MAVEHPAKVDAFVDVRGEANDLRIRSEALPHGENASEQQRGVYGGDFAVPAAFAAAGIEPVIKPAALLKGARGEEAQRVTSPFNSLGALNPVAIRGDAKRSQTKAGGGDARYVLMVLVQRRAVHARAVGHEACVWVGLFPEIAEGALLKVGDESVVGACGSTEKGN